MTNIIADRGIKRRVVWGLTLLILFIILSGVSLLVIRKKILNNVQIMGNEISAHSLLKEAKKIDDYEVFVKTASKWLENLIEKNRNPEDIREWLREYRNYIGKELHSKKVEVYSVVDKRVIGATYWEGDDTFDVDEAEWYREAVSKNGKIIYTDLYVDARTGENVFTIALSLNNKGDVLAIDVYTEELMDEEDPQEALLKGIHYYLCDKSGKIIYMKSNISNDMEEVQYYVENIIKEIDGGKHKISTSFVYDLDNVKRGVYYSRSDKGWLSIVTIPYSVLLSEMMGLYYLYLGSIIFILAIGFILYKRDIEMNKIVEETNKTIRVLGNSYYGIYKINFKEKTYVMIKGSDYIRSLISQKGEYEELEKRLYEIIEDDSKEEFRKTFSIENMRKLVKNRVRDFGGDFKRILRDGYRWSNIRLLFDESLNPGEIILCFKDIDEEKKKNLEYTELLKISLKNMEEKTQAKNIFFSSMSHDMRTPLNGIIGLSELAKNHLKKPEVIKDYLEKINSSSRQLLSLINDILELSKLEFNKKEIVEEEFSLQEKIDEIVAIFRMEATKTNKEFKVNYKVEDNFVRGDLPKLNQILNNLLSNAFKYTKAGGTIMFNIKQIKRDKNSSYAFEIIDTGCGMSKEFLKKIYDPFQRETKFGAKGIKGTGLGMAIVKNLVAQLEGDIRIESELEKGTEVHILIPLEILGKIQEEEKTIVVEESQFQGKKILVAEDNEINMEIITELLRMKGFEVIQAWNGKEAVEIFKNSKINEIDMILMDMQMPELNGCDATKEIRKMTREDSIKIPIIAVTANAFAEDITATTMAGMNSHISKPIDFVMLDRVLKEYLNEQGAEDEK